MSNRKYPMDDAALQALLLDVVDGGEEDTTRLLTDDERHRMLCALADYRLLLTYGRILPENKEERYQMEDTWSTAYDSHNGEDDEGVYTSYYALLVGGGRHE